MHAGHVKYAMYSDTSIYQLLSIDKLLIIDNHRIAMLFAARTLAR